MEMCIRKAIDYSRLHAFKCSMYVIYNVQEKIKLDLKFKKYMFLVYTDEVKGYRLWVSLPTRLLLTEMLSL